MVIAVSYLESQALCGRGLLRCLSVMKIIFLLSNFSDFLIVHLKFSWQDCRTSVWGFVFLTSDVSRSLARWFTAYFYNDLLVRGAINGSECFLVFPRGCSFSSGWSAGQSDFFVRRCLF